MTQSFFNQLEQGSFGFFFDVDFDDILNFYVLISFEGNSTLETVLNFLYIILESSKGTELTFPNLNGIPDQTGLGISHHFALDNIGRPVFRGRGNASLQARVVGPCLK